MNTKQFFSLFAGAMLIALAGALTANAQTDLTTRQALYFTGSKTASIDLKNDVYVASGSTLSLSAELRTSCDNNVCEFNVGLIAMRSGGGSAQSVDIVVQTDKGESSTKTIAFGASETTKQVILPLKLRLGKNNVTVTIDPNKAIAESNENNNSFSGTVMVSWKRANPGNKN